MGVNPILEADIASIFIDGAANKPLKSAMRSLLLRMVRDSGHITASDRLNTPPGAPDDEERFIVNTAPTGAWVGHANEIAMWSAMAGDWLFATPHAGLRAYLIDTDVNIAYKSGAWIGDSLVGLTSLGIVANNAASVAIADQAGASGDTIEIGAALTGTTYVAHNLNFTTGPIAQFRYRAVNTATSVQTVTMSSVDARLQLRAHKNDSTGSNPQIILADTNVYGVPVGNGGNQAGIGFLMNGVNLSTQANFNFVNLGGGGSGEWNSAVLSLWGGCVDGNVQNFIAFYNWTGTDNWNGTKTATTAGLRLGEIGGFGTLPDGNTTQTETWSINGYADQNFTGTTNDGSYTAISNIVFRTAWQALSPEAVVGGFFSGALALGQWAVSGNNFGIGAGGLVMKDQAAAPAAGVANATIVYSRSGMLRWMNSDGIERIGAAMNVDNNFTATQTLLDTAANSSFSTLLSFYKNRTATNNDYVGAVAMYGNDSLANKQQYTGIVGQIGSITSGAEYGIQIFQHMVNGSLINALTIGSATAGGIIVGSPTGGVQGTGTLNLTGYYLDGNRLGTLVESSIAAGAAVSLTTDTPANVTSIALTSGYWEIWGNLFVTVSASATDIRGCFNTTTAAFATLPNGGGANILNFASGSFGGGGIFVGVMRVYVPTTATYYFVAQATFSSGTAAAYGYVGARRIAA